MWSKYFLAIAILAINYSVLVAAEPKCRKATDIGSSWTYWPTKTTTTTSTTTTKPAKPTCTGISTSECSTTRFGGAESSFAKVSVGCQVQNPSFVVQYAQTFDNSETAMADCDALSKCYDYAYANRATAFRVYLNKQGHAWQCDAGDKGPTNTVTEDDATVDRWYYYESETDGQNQR